ncbi:MAG: T9SS type A sorting domain-containing protein [Cryomorphaceae bacterium]|nr:T9SS type A sorting domain-containing protein [Flavobacteriales bacterium]
MKSAILLALTAILSHSLLSQSVAPDQSWAEEGFVNLEIPGEHLVINDYYLADAGHIFAVGYTQVEGSDFKKSILVKIHANGSLDLDFGDSGMVRPELYYDENHEFSDVIERGDGTIRAIGNMHSGQGPAISAFWLELNADGTINTSAPNDGFSEEYGGQGSGTGYPDVYQASNGDLISSRTYFHQSYNFPELSFFRSGNYEWSYSLGDGFDAWFSAGRAYISPEDVFFLPMRYSGLEVGQGTAAILKFGDEGLDLAFGNDGVYEYDESVPGDYYNHATGFGNGQILAAGKTQVGGLDKLLFTKLSDSGVPDETFGDNGHMVYGDETYDYRASEAFYTDAENLIIAKISRSNDGFGNSGLMAFDENGAAIENFGDNGIAWVDNLLPGSFFRTNLIEDEALIFLGRFVNDDGNISSYFGKLLLDFEFEGVQSSDMVFSSSETRYYQEGSKTFALEIDSAAFDGDSIFYPHPQWYSDNDCYLPNSSSHIGKEIRISPGGTHRFVTGRNDTVAIHFQNSLGESWIAFESADGEEIVEATVSNIGSESYLDEFFTVKTISLQMLNADLESVDHPVNDAYFKFTDEEPGLLAFPLLASFPDFSYDIIGTWQPKELVGIAGQSGPPDLKTFDVFNFEVGDEIHFEQGSQSQGDITLWQIAERVLDKTVYPDSLVYEMEIRKWLYSGPVADIDIQPFDTQVISRTIVPDSLFDLPAGRPLIQDYYGNFNWLENAEFGPSKSYYFAGPLFEQYFDEDSCYASAIDWGCFNNPETYQRYYAGLGGPYYNCSASFYYSSWRELLFYSSGDVEWGVPLSTEEQNSGYQTLHIYPNPARDRISISGVELAQHGEVRILNSIGKIVKAQAFQNNEVDVANLPGGMYIVLITQDGRAVYRGRFVKQNE